MNPFVKMLILLVEMETVSNKPSFATEKRIVMMALMKMLVVRAQFNDFQIVYIFLYIHTKTIVFS